MVERPGSASNPGSTSNSASGTVAGNLVQVGSVDRLSVQVHHPFPAAVPWQCPPAPARFVDRVRELDDLRARWARQRPRLVVLTGPPGVGKSALGRRVAAEAREFHPDGQLYADLRLPGGGGVEVAELVGGFLRSLGVAPEWLPAERREREAMLRTLLRDRRMLILVDHVTAAAQVSTWLPDAPGVVVAVVSRYVLDELDEHDPVRVAVAPLDVEDGVALLAGHCGRERLDAEPEAARELVRRCGGLPVVLTVVAARLRRRPSLALARVVAELPDVERPAPGRLGDPDPLVRAVFDGACDDLPAEAGRLYRLLGVHPGPELSVAAADALAGGPAERLLEVLAGANLVEWVGEDRVRVNAFVLAHAADRAEADLTGAERDEALRRVVRYYARHARAADLAAMGDRLRLAEPDDDVARAAGAFATKAAALDWLDRERPNLRGAVEAAAEHGWPAEAWRLCEALWPLFLNRKCYSDWLATHEHGVAAAVAVGDPAVEARMRSQLARALVELRRFEPAEAELRLANEAAERGGNVRVRASVLEFTGRLHLDRGAYDRAVEHYTRALELNREVGRTRGVALQRHFLGQALHRSGDLEGAHGQLRQALELFAPLGDPRNVARVTMSLAAVQRDRGAVDEARELLGRALPALREAGADFFVAQVLEQLAEVDAEHAREHLAEALGIYEDAGSPLAGRVRERLGG